MRLLLWHSLWSQSKRRFVSAAAAHLLSTDGVVRNLLRAERKLIADHEHQDERPCDYAGENDEHGDQIDKSERICPSEQQSGRRSTSKPQLWSYGQNRALGKFVDGLGRRRHDSPGIGWSRNAFELPVKK